MTHCNCRVACASGAPIDTSCITIQALDVRVGDYLDTRGESSHGGFIAEVFSTERSVHGHVILDVKGRRAQAFSPKKRVKVWRDSRLASARPIDLREDRPYRNLTEVHRAGRAGLNATFPVGSLWEVGPFQEGVDPWVVQVTNRNHGAAFTQGENYSHAPEDAEALGKPTWFINTKTIHDPFSTGKDGSGQPPAVLCELTPRMAAKLGLACCDCATYVPPCSCRVLSCNAGVIQSMRAEAESLRDTITEQQRDLDRLHKSLQVAQGERNAAEQKVKAVTAALR